MNYEYDDEYDNELDINRFLKNVKDARDFFSIEEYPFKPTFLSTTVHPGYTIDTYELTVVPSAFFLEITTKTPLTVAPQDVFTYEAINNLLDSINALLRSGIFFISPTNHIEFSFSCTSDQFYSCENPYHILFYGIETINDYIEDIMKVFGGRSVFYLKL